MYCLNEWSMTKNNINVFECPTYHSISSSTLILFLLDLVLLLQHRCQFLLHNISRWFLLLHLLLLLIFLDLLWCVFNRRFFFLFLAIFGFIFILVLIFCSRFFFFSWFFIPNLLDHLVKCWLQWIHEIFNYLLLFLWLLFTLWFTLVLCIWVLISQFFDFALGEHLVCTLAFVLVDLLFIIIVEQ